MSERPTSDVEANNDWASVDHNDDEVVELRRDTDNSQSLDRNGLSTPIDAVYPGLKEGSLYFRSSVEKVYVADESGSKSPFRINFKEKHLYNVFKYTLLGFNGFLILLIIGGVIIYFSEFRDKQFQLNPVEEENFLAESFGKPTGPKYAWVTTALTFSLLLTIPCTGFVGALKEHACLLILYGVIFFVEAIVCLVFKTFWFLFPAFISACAIGLVFLKRTEDDGDGIKSRSRVNFIPFRAKKTEESVVIVQ